MPDLSDNTNWFELDGGNIKQPPNGWPEGQMPSTVNDCARANMGALKRFWDRINPVTTLTPSGGVWTLVLSNTGFPTAYVAGEMFTFAATNASSAGDRFQVNSLGAKPIYRRVGNNAVAVAANDWMVNARPQLVYDASLTGGSGGFVLLNPYVAPFHDDGSGNISTAGSITAGNSINATGPVTSNGSNAGLIFNDRANNALEWMWYADQNSIARLWDSTSGDRVKVDTSGNMTLVGNYLFFANAGAPYVYGDGTNIVLRLGSGNGGTYFENSSGSNVAYITSAGAIAGTGLTINGTSTINGNENVSGAIVAHNVTTVGGDSNGYGMAVNNANFYCTGGASYGGSITTSGVLATGDLGGNVGVHASLAIEADASGTAFYAPNGNAVIGGGIICTGGLGGNVGVHVSQAVQADIGGTAFYAPNGNMVAQNFVPSDARLKSDIADSHIGLDAILGLAPKTYKRIARPEEEELGLIAQDVAAVLPHAVSACELAPDDANLGINYAVITTALIGAVKELTARLASLEARDAGRE